MRKGRSRRRGRMRALLGFVVIAGLAGSAYMLAGSRLFALNAVDVVGTSARDAVIAASGLRVGQSMMHMDLDAVERRIAALPDVASVRVERVGSLRVRITVARRVAAMLVENGEQRWFVDQDGVPVTPVDPAGDVPVLQIPVTFEGSGASAAVETALAVWRSLPGSTRAHLTSLSPIDGGVAFDLGDVHVLFGDPSRARAKLVALHQVQERLAARAMRAHTIDVRAPEHPSARTY